MIDTLVFVRPAFRSRAAELTDALSAAGIDVALSTIDGQGAVDAKAIAKARCVVLCWSSEAGSDDGDELTRFDRIADLAARADNFIHVRLDPAVAAKPLSYDYLVPAGSAFGRWWRGLFDSLYTRDIIGAVRNRRAKIYPPEPLARRRMIQRQAVVAVMATGGALATLSGVLGMGQFIPWPRWNEERAWAAIKDGDCAAIKAFTADYQGGRYAARASAALLHPEQRTTWIKRDRPVAVMGPLPVGPGHADQAAAQGAALEWVTAELQQQCRNHAANLDARLQGVSLPPAAPQCQSIGAGWFCQYDVKAQCQLSEPEPQPFCAKAGSDRK